MPIQRNNAKAIRSRKALYNVSEVFSPEKGVEQKVKMPPGYNRPLGNKMVLLQ